MSIVVVDDDLFLAHASPGHAERPARLLAIRHAIAADAALRDGIAYSRARDAVDAELLTVHDPSLIAAVAAMAQRGGGWFDPDTYATATSDAAARRAAGAAMVAVDAAVNGQHAMALTRPPGHHATADTAMGFCLFNNVAVAARHAQRVHGLQRIAIVDFDVHHGNGTQEIFWTDADVLYTSIHQWPFYPGTGAASEVGAGAGEGTTLNLPVPAGTSAETWLHLITTQLLPRVLAHRPDLIIVSAGFDAHVDDPLAELGVTTEAYAAVTRKILAAAEATGRGTAWCLEGGYSADALGASVDAVLRCLAGIDTA